MKMKKNVLCAIAGIALLFISACDNIHNPFFPEKREQKKSPAIVNAAVPVISVEDSDLSDVECIEGEEVILTVSVEGDEDDFSYQWYRNTEDSNKNGTPIPGAVDPTFRPPTDEPGTTYYYVVITNKKNKKTTTSDTIKVTVNAPANALAGAYSIVITKSGNESGDTVTASPNAGNQGDTVTLAYVVANTALHNLLDFSGVITPIASADSAGSGERTYTINAADSANGVITITAIFTHTNLELDPIAFTDDTGHITKTYGDAAFTNAVAAGYQGSGAITYSSNNTMVATVNASGQVAILKAGSAIITAEKAADAVYARAQKSYMLTVNPKPVTITGLSAANKVYDGTTAATVTGVAVISGLVGGDTVTVSTGTAAFADKNVGTDKTVTFSGWSLSGADAGNYSLSAQPTSVTADIEIEFVSTIEMVPIPAGTFTMGQTGISGSSVHSVTLSEFYMGKYEVTQEQYQAVMESNPSYYHGGSGREPADGENQGKRPVETVSWYDALVFCNKLSMIEGLNPVYSIGGSTDPAVWIANNGGSVPTSGNAIWNGAVMDTSKNGYRLPTEAQWEYACRAGTTTAFNNGNDDYTNATLVSAVAWYSGNAGSKTHEVGLKAANDWGLYDMHGNVFEWCWDWYGSYPSEAQTDPVGASLGSSRVLRGSSWADSAQRARSAFRVSSGPGIRDINIGFRLVRP